MSKVYFVGGYYNTGKFLDSEGDVEQRFYPYSDVAIYDIESVLKLAFVEQVSEWYEDNKEDEDKEWDELSDSEKVAEVMTYVESDEIAGLEICAGLEEANKVLKSCLDDIRAVEEEYEVVEKEQNSEGFYIEVYKKKM